MLDSSVMTTSTDPGVPPREELRREMRARRDVFVAGPAYAAAARTLAGQLEQALRQLEPRLLGVYAALGGEFNPGVELDGAPWWHALPKALPFAQRSPREMHFRRWDGAEPALRDECGIPSCAGPEVVPDVVLVPCLGYTASGWRLGYGGGYFDRWLAAHPEVTAVGVAWSVGLIAPERFKSERHDQPMMLIVTETGIV